MRGRNVLFIHKGIARIGGELRNQRLTAPVARFSNKDELDAQKAEKLQEKSRILKEIEGLERVVGLKNEVTATARRAVHPHLRHGRRGPVARLRRAVQRASHLHDRRLFPGGPAGLGGCVEAGESEFARICLPAPPPADLPPPLSTPAMGSFPADCLAGQPCFQ